ncbi:hypothetical protein BN8_02338 [Fibrisoma limi BUZ 3]|uniref:Uncharacterized protein n=1 Tax=Fibrisoma limi BUZ 3 TaxID=1185876 RepID=I2GH83_9BACT|nr:hypothetical protein BN8_02338 [Fibrisoma limi BUZ 3]
MHKNSQTNCQYLIQILLMFTKSGSLKKRKTLNLVFTLQAT